MSDPQQLMMIFIHTIHCYLAEKRRAVVYQEKPEGVPTHNHHPKHVFFCVGTTTTEWIFHAEQSLFGCLHECDVTALVIEYAVPLSPSPWLFRVRQTLLEFPFLATVATDLVIEYADFHGRQGIVDHMKEMLTPSRAIPAGSSLQLLREQYVAVLYRHVEFIIPSDAFPRALWGCGYLFPQHLPEDLHVGEHFLNFFEAVESHQFIVPDMPEHLIRAEIVFIVCHKFIQAVGGGWRSFP